MHQGVHAKAQPGSEVSEADGAVDLPEAGGARSRRRAKRGVPNAVGVPVKGSGLPLPDELRNRFETYFQRDFSGVRIHEDHRPASIGALAYTRGDNIHFQPGRYRPGDASGQALLAHEVAHIDQQRAGLARPVLHGPGPIDHQVGLEEAADQAGARALSAASPVRGAQNADRPPAVDAIQAVWITLENGKVDYRWHEPQQQNHGYIHMDNDKFVQFKNSGKRHGSNKYTLMNDANNGRGVNLYANNGKLYRDKDFQDEYLDSYDSDLLLNRTRADRTGDGIPKNQTQAQGVEIRKYDVTSYKDAKKRELPGDKMEHDHVPAGESMKKRWALEKDTQLMSQYNHAQHAYDEALAIEIYGKANDTTADHKKYSPTYGGRQKKKDVGPDGQKRERPDVDARYPEAAVFRDISTMLDKTESNRDSDEDRRNQLGAYRVLFRQNAKRGIIDTDKPAYVPDGDPLGDGGIRYASVNNTTAGEQFDQYMMEKIRKVSSEPLYTMHQVQQFQAGQVQQPQPLQQTQPYFPAQQQQSQSTYNQVYQPQPYIYPNSQYQSSNSQSYNPNDSLDDDDDDEY